MAAVGADGNVHALGDAVHSARSVHDDAGRRQRAVRSHREGGHRVVGHRADVHRVAVGADGQGARAAETLDAADTVLHGIEHVEGSGVDRRSEEQHRRRRDA